MRFVIPEIPPSQNRYAGRQNVWEYRNEKQRWKQMVSLLCRPKPKQPIRRATVKLTYFFPDNRRRDPDNYAGKMILDGLTAAGVITDDSFRCIELILKGECDRSNPRTEVEVFNMNIQCVNCEYGNRCTNCMYNDEQKKRDLEQEQKERLGSKNQKKTADMRLYKRLKKREARQRELAEEFPFLYGNTQDNPYHMRTARFD